MQWQTSMFYRWEKEISWQTDIWKSKYNANCRISLERCYGSWNQHIFIFFVFQSINWWRPLLWLFLQTSLERLLTVGHWTVYNSFHDWTAINNALLGQIVGQQNAKLNQNCSFWDKSTVSAGCFNFHKIMNISKNKRSISCLLA